MSLVCPFEKWSTRWQKIELDISFKITRARGTHAQLLPTSPADGATSSGGQRISETQREQRRERILTVNEEKLLLAASEHRADLRTLFICLLDTGARLSELLKHLHWRSVCFASRTLTLEAMTTKTLKARQVSMSERMLRELATLWETSSRLEDARVFDTTVRVARREFMLACKAAR